MFVNLLPAKKKISETSEAKAIKFEKVTASTVVTMHHISFFFLVAFVLINEQLQCTRSIILNSNISDNI